MADEPQGFATRPSLLLRIRDPSDRVSWQTFVDIYGRLVYRHCRARGLRHEDAENVTQEVFIAVSRAVRDFTYQPERGRFRSWLGTVTRNEVNRFLKKAARPAGPGDQALEEAEARTEDTSWDEGFHAHLLTVALERCRPHFEAATWRAFELAWLENRPAAEVARELDTPIDKVYVAKSRVLDRLEREVLDLADDSVLFGR